MTVIDNIAKKVDNEKITIIRRKKIVILSPPQFQHLTDDIEESESTFSGRF